jgi:hypothetical protein
MIYLKSKTNVLVEYYSKDEADELKIVYVPWRNAQSTDTWALSDDDYVVKIKFVKYITELQYHGITPRIRRRVVTELGTRYPHGKRPFNVAEHIKTKSYGLYPKVWWRTKIDNEPAILRLFAKAVMNHSLHMDRRTKYNRSEYAVFIDIAKRIYEKEDRWYEVRSLFNHDEVRMEIQEEIKKIAKERGYDVKKVFDLLDRCEQYADAKGDAKTILALAKEVGCIVGMTRKLNTPTQNQLPQTEIELPGSDPAFEAIIERNNGTENEE